jgi:hypothetical protein
MPLSFLDTAILPGARTPPLHPGVCTISVVAFRAPPPPFPFRHQVLLYRRSIHSPHARKGGKVTPQ